MNALAIKISQSEGNSAELLLTACLPVCMHSTEFTVQRAKKQLSRLCNTNHQTNTTHKSGPG